MRFQLCLYVCVWYMSRTFSSLIVVRFHLVLLHFQCISSTPVWLSFEYDVWDCYTVLGFDGHQFSSSFWIICVVFWGFSWCPCWSKVDDLCPWNFFVGYFVWKITILRQQIIFFPILGGGGGARRAPGAPPLPPGSAPATRNSISSDYFCGHLYNMGIYLRNPGRFAPMTCSPRKVSRFAPLNCYYIIIDEVFFDNFLIIIYLLASYCGFSYYYRFSDIAISSVNPSFIWRLEFSKNG